MEKLKTMEIDNDRTIIYGVYSYLINDYLIYYRNISDAIKLLEDRIYENTTLDYSRSVLIDDESGDVLIAVHPIVLH